jgi:hypothetical protein
MANIPNKQKIQNTISTLVQLLAGILMVQKKNLNIEKRWPRNDMDVEDDSYQTFALFYNKEMDWLVVANTITNDVDTKDILRSNGEKESEVPETTYMDS